MKKILKIILIFTLLINVSFSEDKKTDIPKTTIQKEVVYPDQIIWEYEIFSNTNEFYPIDSINVKKIGEWFGFEIYEEVEAGYNSKFIKTDKGYLHYAKEDVILKKPNIYLYPLKEEKINVSIEFDGKIIASYPKYNNGWSVIAKENGELKNLQDNRSYSYLFWEGSYKKNWDIKEGFLVKGTDTASFLQEKLEYMGLIPKEYNEFIVYWLPIMEKNKYNYISFVNEEYSKEIKLNVEPKPDKVIRIFMVFKGLNNEIKFDEQKLTKNERKGFTVVEWGGSEIK